MSKGSKRRPTTISAKEEAERWERAFGKKDKVTNPKVKSDQPKGKYENK